MYIYLIQPEGPDSSVYKIGMSKKQSLDRLKSYPKTARYIRFAEIGIKYREAESELITLFNENFTLNNGDKKIYFKLSDSLYDKQALAILLKKSKYSDRMKIDEIIKEIDTNEYFLSKFEEYEKSNRQKAKNILRL